MKPISIIQTLKYPIKNPGIKPLTSSLPFIWEIYNDQPAEVTPNGGLVREAPPKSPFFSGLGIIVNLARNWMSNCFLGNNVAHFCHNFIRRSATVPGSKRFRDFSHQGSHLTGFLHIENVWKCHLTNGKYPVIHGKFCTNFMQIYHKYGISHGTQWKNCKGRASSLSSTPKPCACSSVFADRHQSLRVTDLREGLCFPTGHPTETRIHGKKTQKSDF